MVLSVILSGVPNKKGIAGARLRLSKALTKHASDARCRKTKGINFFMRFRESKSADLRRDAKNLMHQ